MARKGNYRSTKTGKVERFDSSYEKRRFVTLDSDPRVKRWTKGHKIRIPYRMGKRRRRYVPDILVEYVDGRKVLEEVKGKVWNPLEFYRKNTAAAWYCAMAGMRFRIVYEADLEVVA